MKLYSEAAMGRAMKVQEVILRAMAKKITWCQAAEVLELYRERYAACNVRHFHEKLGEEHGIQLSYSWVKLALQGAGLIRNFHFELP